MLRQLTTGDGTNFSFQRVALRFESTVDYDIFTRKNNKSLADTLVHPRYKGLMMEAAQFQQFMHSPLGQFLAGLKRNGDPFYKRFLNKHGDERFSVFLIDAPDFLTKKGIYAFYVGEELRYIGRCRDTMKQRINQGYGKIHPKNCYIDGQSTNCHLNAKVTEAGHEVDLWLCPLESDDEIILAEAKLIGKFRPIWNVQVL